MALEPQNLDELNQDDYDAAFLYLAQLIEEKHPDLDARRGVLGTLVVALDAIAAAAHSTQAERLRQSQSLLEVDADPTLADDATVDKILSNFRITRKDAQFATGDVTIVLDQLVAVTIPAGSQFTANGKTFTTNVAYAARTNSSQVLDSTTDRLIQQTGTDRYAFTITVTATEAGSASMLRKDDQLIPDSAPQGFVQAYAAEDFSGGSDALTTSELLTELQEGLAVRAWSGRTAVGALIRQTDTNSHELVKDDFKNIQSLSIVGFGDAEQIRDQRGLFPVSGGGRVDVYVRSQALPKTKELTLSASLLSIGAESSEWSFSLDRDALPGFYRVVHIRRTDEDSAVTSFEISSDIRGYDPTNTDLYVPDIQSVMEAAYSRYQTGNFKFLDNRTDTSGMTAGTTTADYLVTVEYMPLIPELQDYLGDRDVIWPAGDVLVRAAVPCYVGVSIGLEARRADINVDEDGIANALADYVNKLDFPGRLYASALARIVDEFLPDNIDTGTLTMTGSILRPDGTTAFIHSDDILIIPDDPAVLTTGRTTAFFLSPQDVAISITSVSVPQV